MSDRCNCNLILLDAHSDFRRCRFELAKLKLPPVRWYQLRTARWSSKAILDGLGEMSHLRGRRSCGFFIDITETWPHAPDIAQKVALAQYDRHDLTI